MKSTTKVNTRATKPITMVYQKLHEFRLAWESRGGSRRTLRYQRKVQGNVLFPVFVN